VKLYSYWRSTAAYRVRIALNLKGLRYDIVPVHLLANGGEQHLPDYTALNPSHLVPTLKLDDGTILTQSLAIIDYLEALWPAPPLLPADPVERTQVQAVAHVMAVDIHPINNLRVVQHLEARFGATREVRVEWMRHWSAKGFDAVQQMLRPDSAFAFGDTPTLADICLVAQYYNARRWGLDLAPYARLSEIEKNCLTLKAFASAAPENQPDAIPA